jgi:hypothetical protein
VAAPERVRWQCRTPGRGIRRPWSDAGSKSWALGVARDAADPGVLEDLFDAVERDEELRDAQLGLAPGPVLAGPVVEEGHVDTAERDAGRRERHQQAPVLLLRLDKVEKNEASSVHPVLLLYP